MSPISNLLGFALRLVALMLGVAALATLLRLGTASQPVGATPDPELEAPSALAGGIPEPQAWLLGGDGWVIRVDGAEVPIPTFSEMTRSRPRASVSMSISPFDQIIISYARAEGFDWRLIAALIFEESRFDPTAESEMGAVGLMQVRPIAAAEVGEVSYLAPEDNVRTGVRYLRQLDLMFADVRATDRLSFVLAAYNMGPAHVRDAQRLARRIGYDSRRWEGGVELVVPFLELPNVYKDLPAGYAKGNLTVGYVRRILDRYERYLDQTPAAGDLDIEASSLSEPDATRG